MLKFVSASLVLFACLSFAVAADEKSKLDGVKCPVSGADVKEDKTADHNGGKVYFCCGNCPTAFSKDVAKYETKANYQLVQTKQAKQEKCPFSGGDLKDGTEVEVGSVKVKFCCNNCQGKVSKAEGDEKLKLVFSADAFKKGFTVEKKK